MCCRPQMNTCLTNPPPQEPLQKHSRPGSDCRMQKEMSCKFTVGAHSGGVLCIPNNIGFTQQHQPCAHVCRMHAQHTHTPMVRLICRVWPAPTVAVVAGGGVMLLLAPQTVLALPPSGPLQHCTATSCTSPVMLPMFRTVMNNTPACRCCQ